MPTTTDAPPMRKPGTKLCLAVTKQGVTAYGNKAAFEHLAEWLKSMASSDPVEHFECHTIWNLQDEEGSFGENAIKNVYPLFSRQAKTLFAKKDEHGFGFELTFMMAPDSELDELAAYQKTSLLPDSWNEAERLIFHAGEED